MNGSTPMSVLSRLIAPVSEDEFFSNYYERKCLHLGDRDPNAVYSGFPDVEGFEQLLWQHEYKLRQSLRVNKGGKYLKIPHHASGKDVFRWALERFNEGYTLILNGTDHISLDIARVARAIESETFGKVAANAFFTPAENRGFLPHFDTHDVFVLQLAGSKHWYIYDQRINLPVDRQIRLLDQNTVGEPIEKYELLAGDLLYVPRGLVHGAFTASNPSLHITMGYRPMRWSDYLSALVGVVAEECDALRSSVRPRELCLDDEAFETIFSKFTDHVRSPRVRQGALDRVGEAFLAQLRPLPGGHLKALNDSKKIAESTMVFRRDNTPCEVFENDTSVRIQFPGVGLASSDNLKPGAVSAPLSAGGAIRYMATTNSPFCACDLPKILSKDSRIALVRKLVEEGLLVLVD